MTGIQAAGHRQRSEQPALTSVVNSSHQTESQSEGNACMSEDSIPSKPTQQADSRTRGGGVRPRPRAVEGRVGAWSPGEEGPSPPPPRLGRTLQLPGPPCSSRTAVHPVEEAESAARQSWELRRSSEGARRTFLPICQSLLLVLSKLKQFF